MFVVEDIFLRCLYEACVRLFVHLCARPYVTWSLGDVCVCVCVCVYVCVGVYVCVQGSFVCEFVSALDLEVFVRACVPIGTVTAKTCACVARF